MSESCHGNKAEIEIIVKSLGTTSSKINSSGIQMKTNFSQYFFHSQQQSTQYSDNQIAINGIDQNGQGDILTSGYMPDHKNRNKQQKNEKYIVIFNQSLMIK